MAFVTDHPGAGRWLGRVQTGLTTAIGIAVLACSSTAAAKEPSLEQAVKASYLFKFAPFITWPERAFAGSRTFAICILGDDPFGPVLDDVVRGQRIAGRRIAVRRLGNINMGKSGCHLAFAGRSLQSTDYAPFADLAGQPVLTVSDANGGASGAIIRFVTEAGRVRFQIDESAARANGLVISSKLLSLAISVDR